jgi:mannose-6-phosphate isomerase-like protein (cupin superfamily)
VFDVQIPPGDTTLYHIHDVAILYVPVSISPTDAQILGGKWAGVGPQGSSRFRLDATELDTLYAPQPVTHRVANVGTGPFRLIAVTNGRVPSTPNRALRDSSPGTLERSSSWFRQTRLILEPGTSSAWYTSRLTVVLVQPAEGYASIDRALTATPNALDGPGSWVYLPAGTRFRLRNEGANSITVVIVQVR